MQKSLVLLATVCMAGFALADSARAGQITTPTATPEPRIFGVLLGGCALVGALMAGKIRGRS